MDIRKRLLVGSGLFALVLYAGCSAPKLPHDLPKLHPTVIMVVQDEQPLPDALVTLTNVDPTINWSCIARTDASGRATMQTNGMYAGAPEGTYKATVVKQDVEVSGPDPYADAPDPKVDRDAYQEWHLRNESQIVSALARQQRSVYDLVDAPFGSVETTTLEVTITAGRNQHTLDVGKAVRTLIRGRPR